MNHKNNGRTKLFRDRTFAKLWFAGAFNGVGRWLEMLIVGVSVFQLSNSALAVAVLFTVRLVPLAVTGPLVGLIAHRIGRRSILRAATGLALLASFLQAGLAAAGALEIWHLGVGAFISGCLWSIDLTIRRTMMGEVVGMDRVAAAMVLDSTSNHGTRMIGPFLGGALLHLFDLSICFLLCGILYAGSLILFLLLQRPGALSPAAKGSQQSEGTPADGSWKNRIFAGTLFGTAVFNIFAFPYISMIPVLGEKTLHADEFMIGILMGTEGAGALIGTLLLIYLAKPKIYRRIYWSGLFICFLMIAVFAVSPSFLLAGLAVFFAGIGISGFSAMQPTLVLLSVPEHARDRAMGMLSLSIGAAPVGFLFIGWLASVAGTQQALLISTAAGALLVTVLLRAWPELIDLRPRRKVVS